MTQPVTWQAVCEGVGGASRLHPVLHPDGRESHDRQWLLPLRRGAGVGPTPVQVSAGLMWLTDHHSTTQQVNLISFPCVCVCAAVVPAVLQPSDQPSLLPEVQQLSPVRCPRQQPAPPGLQPRPRRQMIHTRVFLQKHKVLVFFMYFYNFQSCDVFDSPWVSCAAFCHQSDFTGH